MRAIFTYILSIISIASIMANNNTKNEDCDVCSTSSSSTSINFDFNNQNYIGLYYLYQNYRTYNGIFNNSKKFNEHYRTLQLTSNYMITSKWNISFSIPLHIHNRNLEDNSLKQNESGLGDLSFQSTYRILQSDTMANTNWFLNVGGGIKSPTAKFKNRDGQGTNPNFNLGSGAWDYSLTSLFNLKFKNSGLNTQITYVFKTENETYFQFGNQTDISILYYQTMNWFTNQPFNIFSGIKSEYYDNNKQFGYLIDDSKGYIHNLQIGGNIPLKQVQIGCMAYIPIHQNLMNNRINSQFKALIYALWNL